MAASPSIRPITEATVLPDVSTSVFIIATLVTVNSVLVINPTNPPTPSSLTPFSLELATTIFSIYPLATPTSPTKIPTRPADSILAFSITKFLIIPPCNLEKIPARSAAPVIVIFLTEKFLPFKIPINFLFAYVHSNPSKSISLIKT